MGLINNIEPSFRNNSAPAPGEMGKVQRILTTFRHFFSGAHNVSEELDTWKKEAISLFNMSNYAEPEHRTPIPEKKKPLLMLWFRF